MNYLILGGVLICVATLASGLQCHQCTTLEYKTCRDPYFTDNLGDCDDDQYCVKYKTVVKIRDSGYINGWERFSQVVTRTCEPRQGKKEGCIGWQNNGGVTIKCWCGSDGCNGSSVLGPTTLVISAACLIVLCLLSFRQ
ncbi:uncharacterized protein LOC101859738 isoform X2 [Aplysia californica]|uniref:Uncharacterized protein LOC101859738 isoform X2 n=1 Tax=Aplysia californica TaxID=6500 RepID=A0ABM0K561_APLCA|nr:uncharacterized protein LOC101859738 isoform X2 [Aplysia californica]